MGSFSRREFMAAMAAGGAVIAGDLWIPGEKVISIPKPVITVADRIRHRQYGYDEMGDYSWGLVSWWRNDGSVGMHKYRVARQNVHDDLINREVMAANLDRIVHQDIAHG